jgi:hypothetical protein
MHCRVASGFAMMMRAFLLAVLTSGHFVPAAARVTHSVAREDAVGHAAARLKALPLSDLARLRPHHFPTSQPVAGPAITPGATLQATVDQAVAAGARELRVPQAVYVFNASSLVISGAKDLTMFEPGLSESITAKCASITQMSICAACSTPMHHKYGACMHV